MPHRLLNVFSRQLQQNGHSRRFTVEVSPGVGWRVRDQQDAQPARQRDYDDWHRVERAISRFAIEAAQLARAGWREA